MQNNSDILHLKANPQLTGQVRFLRDIVYSRAQGEDLQLDALVPWTAEHPGFAIKYPLVVFVQGSSWTVPDRGYEIPQLGVLARKGYVVATVGHRSIFDGHSFPAFLEDVKCAIRFLRANADTYAIDAKRVAVWGTSSGGNAALLAGLTGGDPAYITEEYADASDTVQAVISCFGPTDIADIIWQNRNAPGVEPVIRAAFGNDESTWKAAMERYSPLNLVQDGQRYPPFLLLHGNSDLEVSYHQMLRFRQRLQECGASVSAVCVEGAGHEWDFWSDAVYKVIRRFLDSQLGQLPA